MNLNIQTFFAQLIELPTWINKLPYNSPVVMAFCVNKFIGRDMSPNEIAVFHDESYGSTPDNLISYFKSINLETKRPEILTHQIIKEGLHSGVFTFLAYHNERPNMSFVRFYDPYLNKFLLFDFKFDLLELSDLDIFNYFTLDTRNYLM